MSFYRSDTISHYNLVIPRESAWDIMNKIGQTELIHIVPSKETVLNKPFFMQVKRCEESLTRVEYLEKVLYDRKIFEPQNDFSEDTYRELYKVWEDESTNSMKNPISMLDGFQEKVTSAWNYYHDLGERMDNLKKRINLYRENLAIISAGERKFGRSFFTNSQVRVDQLGEVFLRSASKVGFKTGIIGVDEEIRFKRTIFRITKGNCMVECIPFDDIFDKLQDEEKTKTVFFVLFPAQANNYLERKIDKLVQMYCDEKYQLPTRNEDFEPLIKSFQDGYNETEKLLSLTEEELDQYLQVLASPAKEIKFFRLIIYIKLYLIKERELYESLNEMELFNNFLKAEIYVKNQDVSSLHQMLSTIERNMKIPSGQIIASEANKFPTSFTRNSYTCSAQEIVETYGIPRYQEANPSYFTTVTFPFLFGVMFGDIAHGLILFLFGVLLCFKHQDINNLAIKILAPHRYLITLMGFFAFYCGWVYNDFMSISLDVFGSCYDLKGVEADEVIPRKSLDCVYGFGLDPVWAVAQNNLNYVNSLKMKISVIIAVVHMTLGVFVKASNAIHFKKWMDFVFEFVPQLAFLTVLFAYMDFLIIFKWLKPWDSESIQFAPSIITTMINLPLRLGKTDDCCGGEPMWGEPGNTTQDHIQLILLIIAAISVPLMLLPKPLIEIFMAPKPTTKVTLMSRKSLEYSRLLSDNISESNIEVKPSQAHHEEEEHDSSEIFVHQMIETIEYVLGCISNTASYLRLWALSLAHSQLSEVFFQKTVEGGISKGWSGLPIMILTFPILAAATFGVLLCMDSMECFLHTLRLHWVQFQNKFYKGDGFAFVYFNFTTRIKSIMSKSAV